VIQFGRIIALDSSDHSITIHSMHLEPRRTQGWPEQPIIPLSDNPEILAWPLQYLLDYYTAAQRHLCSVPDLSHLGQIHHLKTSDLWDLHGDYQMMLTRAAGFCARFG